jgi:hypothetical protein
VPTFAFTELDFVKRYSRCFSTIDNGKHILGPNKQRDSINKTACKNTGISMAILCLSCRLSSLVRKQVDHSVNNLAIVFLL